MKLATHVFIKKIPKIALDTPKIAYYANLLKFQYRHPGVFILLSGYAYASHMSTLSNNHKLWKEKPLKTIKKTFERMQILVRKSVENEIYHLACNYLNLKTKILKPWLYTFGIWSKKQHVCPNNQEN
jgi:hypothetical protein